MEKSNSLTLAENEETPAVDFVEEKFVSDELQSSLAGKRLAIMLKNEVQNLDLKQASVSYSFKDLVEANLISVTLTPAEITLRLDVKGMRSLIAGENAPVSEPIVLLLDEKQNAVNQYAMKFKIVIYPQFHNFWDLLWKSIMDDEEFASFLFDSGKQKFSKSGEQPINRNGIAKVVSFFKSECSHIFMIRSNSQITEYVEGTKKHAIRQQLAKWYTLTSDQMSVLKRLLTNLENSVKMAEK